jgi:hypothetical protein
MMRLFDRRLERDGPGFEEQLVISGPPHAGSNNGRSLTSPLVDTVVGSAEIA